MFKTLLRMKNLTFFWKTLHALALTLVVALGISGCKSHLPDGQMEQNPTTSEEVRHEVWSIGENNNSGTELALGPADYKKFLERDFGYEDRYYLIGHSQPAVDFPYVLPGPDDTWGGTWGTSGWRTHEINILFGVE